MSQFKYCILEDDPAQRLALRAAFEKCDCDFFDSTESLLDSKKVYDVAVLDCVISDDRSGIYAARKLIEENPDIKIFFYTALTSGFHFQLMSSLGDVIPKQNDVFKLIEIMATNGV